MKANLLGKIVAKLGVKNLVLGCAAVTLTGAIGYEVVEKVVSNNNPTQITVEYGNGELAVTSPEMKKDYNLSLKYYDEQSDEYKAAFGALNSDSSKVTALEVVDISVVDKDGNPVELKEKIKVKLNLLDSTKEASGDEYILWDSIFIKVENAKFSSSSVEFESSELGRFVISKRDGVEITNEIPEDEKIENTTEDTAKEDSKTEESKNEDTKKDEVKEEQKENTSNNKDKNQNTSNTNKDKVDNNKNNSGNKNNNTTTDKKEEPKPSTPTTKPEEPKKPEKEQPKEEPKPSTPNYKTISLYTKTTYNGFAGYFTKDDNIMNVDLIKYGVSSSDTSGAIYCTEYVDAKTGEYILFACSSDVYPTDIMDHVYGVGVASVKVNVK